MNSPRPAQQVRTPREAELSCTSTGQEAAMRMLIRDGSNAMADSPIINALVNAAADFHEAPVAARCHCLDLPGITTV